MKKIKPQPKFTATLELKTPRHFKCNKKEWDTIEPEKRGSYTHHYYYKIVMIENPAIEQLRKILKKQRVKFTEYPFCDKIIFTTDV